MHRVSPVERLVKSTSYLANPILKWEKSGGMPSGMA